MTSTIAQSPNLTCEQACKVALDEYGLVVTAEALPSERDQNFRLRTEDGRAFVLKIANGEEDQAFLEAQNQVMTRLHERSVAYCPQLLQTQSGNDFFEVDVLLMGTDGTPLQDATLHVDAAMPHHRHGMNHRSHMVHVGPGRWRAEDMLFHMPGSWVLYFDVKQDGIVRRAQVDVEVD